MTFERLFDVLPNYLEKYAWKKDALAAKVDGKWKPGLFRSIPKR
jgi:hypothetical protein